MNKAWWFRRILSGKEVSACLARGYRVSTLGTHYCSTFICPGEFYSRFVYVCNQFNLFALSEGTISCNGEIEILMKCNGDFI